MPAGEHEARPARVLAPRAPPPVAAAPHRGVSSHLNKQGPGHPDAAKESRHEAARVRHLLVSRPVDLRVCLRQRPAARTEAARDAAGEPESLYNRGLALANAGDFAGAEA